MIQSKPRVSIGLPVHNGERFLPAALEALLAQSFTDFEVIISDNASTDRTPLVCRQYAARDPRIRFISTPRNLGAAPNFNRTLSMARGEYFRWAAHDDSVGPDYLLRCVEALDRDASVVLAHTQVRIVDADGHPLTDHVYLPRTSSHDPTRRFHDLLFVRNQCYEVFGLVRAQVLRQTGLMGAFPVGDRVLLAELAFRGRFFEVPERLFFSRDHPSRSVRRLANQQDRAPWFDTRYAGRITFPEWRTFIEYWRAIERAPLSRRDRHVCQLYMLNWLRHYRKRMRRDVLVALSRWLSRRVDTAGALMSVALMAAGLSNPTALPPSCPCVDAETSFDSRAVPPRS